MEPLTVKTETSAYRIVFNAHYDGLPAALTAAGLADKRVCIVTDSHVAPLYLDAVRAALTPVSKAVYAVVFEAGEKNKHLATVTDLYRQFASLSLDRTSVIVALGGGVTGDMAGFCAATYMRGIPFCQLPTSLLAQVDASVGGKTGVDFDGVKNLIGAFYPPRLVYINTQTLTTLPRTEWVSGMGEVIKHALIGDPAYYAFLRERQADIRALETTATTALVAASCRIKAAVVTADEKEQGLREILNFGHTFGHAVESLSGYALPHGCCVSVGICAALHISCRMGKITPAERDAALGLIGDYGLPTAVPDMRPEAIYQKMFSDKKNKDNKIRLVLLDAIGKAYTDEQVDSETIMSGIRCIC